jgi:alpha-glucosidase
MKEDKEIKENIDITVEQLEGADIQHVNNPIVGIKPIEKKFLGAVKEVRQENNKYFFSDGAASVEVTIVSDEIIKIRLAPHSVFLDEFSYAVPSIDSKATVFAFSDEEEYFINSRDEEKIALEGSQDIDKVANRMI